MALLGRRQERLDELVAELGADRVVAVAGDVADPEVNARLVEVARSRFGRLDSLVANAGIGAYGGIMSLTDDADPGDRRDQLPGHGLERPGRRADASSSRAAATW